MARAHANSERLRGVIAAGAVLALAALAAARPGMTLTVAPAAAPAAPAEVLPNPAPTGSVSAAQAVTLDESGSYTPGLDVSHYQGKVDFSALANAGYAFVYAKATDGVSYVDPRFAANRKGAAAARIAFGAYHFYEPSDAPQAQADHFTSTLGGISGQLPPTIDVERSPASGQDLAADVVAFAKAVEAATGCAPVLYTNRSFWTSHLSALTEYTFWFADYAATPDLPEGAPAWTFWQSDSHGQAPGITGAVDLDWFAGPAADLASLACP